MGTSWKREWKILAGMMGGFLICFFLPVDASRFNTGILEALQLARWYAREHVLLCLVPAFFIAGAISAFLSQASVMRYLGAGANKVLAYAVASVSGTVLAVCSCTVLPLFAGIYRMGAGLGPATAFLYSGPAINVLAIILTARVLGPELGLARAVGAVVFSVVIGLAMHVIFRNDAGEQNSPELALPDDGQGKALWQQVIYFASMIGILVFANWAEVAEASGLWRSIAASKWLITAGFAIALGAILASWYRLGWGRVLIVGVMVTGVAVALPDRPQVAFMTGILGLSVLTSSRGDELGEWFDASWGFAKQILPLLFVGVLAAGALLGRPQHEGWIPSVWVSTAVGGNSLAANLLASVVGAFMYFATLTEVPILEGLIGSGMGKGPALALLLAGPALSLPNMLVIRSVLGTRKTAVYVVLVIVMATASGVIYGSLSG